MVSGVRFRIVIVPNNTIDMSFSGQPFVCPTSPVTTWWPTLFDKGDTMFMSVQYNIHYDELVSDFKAIKMRPDSTSW